MKVSDTSSGSDVGGPMSAPEPTLWSHCLVPGDPGQRKVHTPQHLTILGAILITTHHLLQPHRVPPNLRTSPHTLSVSAFSA